MKTVTLSMASVALAVFTAHAAYSTAPTMHFPAVAKYGGIVPLPDAAEPPRRGMKIAFDIVGEGKPTEVHKGLESVARYLNLHAQAGHSLQDLQLALVLHGGATKVALHDAAFARRESVAGNPNSELIRELKRHGVGLYVCGQSLARNKLPPEDVAPEFTIAVSAMTFNANRQQDGFSTLHIP